MSGSRPGVVLALAALAAGCASSPFAANGDAKARQVEVDRRLFEVEQQAVASRHEVERLTRRVAQLEAALARAGSGPAAPLPAVADALPTAGNPPPPARTAIEETELAEDEAPNAAPASGQESYDSALALLRAGQATEAEAAFSAFLAAQPASDLADNAAFWIGEARLARGDRAGAIEAYRSAIERYPSGNKVPDALYKLGHTLALDGELDGARLVWRELAARFPGSAAAERARERLTQP